MFEIKNISKQYPSGMALNNVSLNITEGLNFILGSSGSGKTTLLKIMSGLENDYEGEIFLDGVNLKSLTDQDKSAYFNQVFGFVWQEFNLLDEATVMENVLLPLYLKDDLQMREVKKLLRRVKMGDFADKKVKYLSGGQKQRVAIVRELMKNPKIIIADEPTSALDTESSQIIMELFNEEAKNKTVIIVSHDLSLVSKGAKVFELDKGELVKEAECSTIEELLMPMSVKNQKLSLNSANQLAWMNMKNNASRFILLVLSLIMSSTLLLVSFSGAIQGNSEKIFDDLFATYGNSIMDISLAGSFMSASGDKDDQPKADVSQDISGFYDQYLTDERISYVLISQAYNDIQLEIEGKSYQVNESNNVPILNELVAGNYPSGTSNEVLVSESLVKQIGISNEEAIGKSIEFKATIYSWATGEPVKMPVSISAVIVGVGNSDMVVESEGEYYTYTIEDSFFFSKNASDEMRKQASLEQQPANLILRTKTLEDLIAIKDELNAEGIVPLGRFELVEDMVRLNQQSTSQSSLATKIMSVLALVLFLAITMATTLTRKKQFAIYRISGFNKKHCAIITIMENFLLLVISSALFALASPLISKVTISLFQLDIMGNHLIPYGLAILWLSGMISTMVAICLVTSNKVLKALKTGGNS